jgi:glutaredoxin
MTRSIRVYGADWCGDCIRAKRVLDRTGTSYEWIDVDVIAGAAEEARRISGRKNIPVVVLPDGSILVEPTDPELERAITGS